MPPQSHIYKTMIQPSQQVWYPMSYQRCPNKVLLGEVNRRSGPLGQSWTHYKTVYFGDEAGDQTVGWIEPCAHLMFSIVY